MRGRGKEIRGDTLGYVKDEARLDNLGQDSSRNEGQFTWRHLRQCDCETETLGNVETNPHRDTQDAVVAVAQEQAKP